MGLLGLVEIYPRSRSSLRGLLFTPTQGSKVSITPRSWNGLIDPLLPDLLVLSN